MDIYNLIIIIYMYVTKYTKQDREQSAGAIDGTVSCYIEYMFKQIGWY